MKMVRYLLLLSTLLFLPSGCRTPTFKVNTDAIRIHGIGLAHRKNLAIRTLADHRGYDAENWIILAFVPGFPFGWSKYDRIEDRFEHYFNVSAADDLTDGVVKCIRRSELFDNITMIGGKDIGDADYVLTGSIENMRYSRLFCTHTVSIFAFVPWIFGVPFNGAMQRLDLRLSLQDRTGKEVWKWETDKESQMHIWVQGLYYRHGHPYRMYGRTLIEHMNDALSSLRDFLQTSN